ncbi:MAG: hypothetical protein ACP5O3_02205 [Candidatus Micrarchaeia archaeon]|jgi:hypothetical protein
MAWGIKGLKNIVKEEHHGKAFAETREGNSLIHLGRRVSESDVAKLASAYGFSTQKFRNALLIKDSKGVLVAKLTPLPRVSTLFIEAGSKRKREALQLAQDLL